MSIAVNHYDPQKVLVLVSGVPLTEFSDGDDVIVVERDEPEFSFSVGIQGDAVGVKNANVSGRVTVRLQQTSPSNAILFANLALQRAVNATFPIVVKDAGNPLNIVAARHMLIEGPANQQYGQNHNSRDWTFVCADLEVAG